MCGCVRTGMPMRVILLSPVIAGILNVLFFTLVVLFFWFNSSDTLDLYNKCLEYMIMGVFLLLFYFCVVCLWWTFSILLHCND